MVTTEDIESLGWTCYSISPNGGSKKFIKRCDKFKSMIGEFSIFSHSDNKSMNSELREDITISRYRLDMTLVVLFSGKVKTIDDLKEILVKIGADKELIREHKINQIVG